MPSEVILGHGFAQTTRRDEGREMVYVSPFALHADVGNDSFVTASLLLPGRAGSFAGAMSELNWEQPDGLMCVEHVDASNNWSGARPSAAIVSEFRRKLEQVQRGETDATITSLGPPTSYATNPWLRKVIDFTLPRLEAALDVGDAAGSAHLGDIHRRMTKETS